MPVIQTPKEFVADFVKEASTAKKRIYLQSMLFERGEILSSFEPVLIKKAHEGVDVQVVTDWVSAKYVEDNPNFIPSLNLKTRRYNRKVQRENRAVVARWRQAGIKIIFTNIPTPLASTIAIAGRNHIKMYLVDEIGWVGGVNLFDHALTLIDVMVKYDDAELIHALAKQFSRINANKPTNNYAVSLKENKLIIDAGIRGKSLIYDEALQMIQNANHSITFASQFLPDGKLLNEMIAAARRGLQVTIITSNKNNKVFKRFPYNIPYTFLTKKIETIPTITLCHRDRRVHAKLLIVDEKEALFGSHNMTRIGVLLGTEEIAIHTTDTQLVHGLSELINSTP